MSVFVHAQGIKTVHARWGGVKKCQNSVHVVVEWPLMGNWIVQNLLQYWLLPHRAEYGM